MMEVSQARKRLFMAEVGQGQEEMFMMEVSQVQKETVHGGSWSRPGRDVHDGS